MIKNILLYTGHSALVVALLVVCGTALGIAGTSLVELTEVVHPTTSDYIVMLIKSVPGLTVLGLVVYMFIQYLKHRDEDIRLLFMHTLATIDKTQEAITVNTKTLEELRLDIRRKS